MSLWISAADACRLLHVSRSTLYAYVSRGHVRSQAMSGSSRERRYSRDDAERLRRRSDERRNPDKAAARALYWGLPILESSIALIDGEKLYYRGHDAVLLSRTRSLEDVAALIWTGQFGMTFPSTPLTAARGGRMPIGEVPFTTRAQAQLAIASSRDPLAFDLRPMGVALTGWRILQLLTRSAVQSDATAPTVEATLAQAWRVNARGTELLRAALILCADHELNVSSFTARCVASAGSHPYAVVIAGLAALEGSRHGGVSARVEAMLSSMRRVRDLETALGERLRRGEPIDGFGHPLYRQGDPRATALLALLREGNAKSAEWRYVSNVVDAATTILGDRPTIDFALAAVARVLRLPPGSPLTLFALGRTIGWIGHAIEQYTTGELIRPRAKYVGALPAV